MSKFKKALNSKESKEAIDKFLVDLIFTGNPHKSADAGITTAKQNGAIKKIVSGGLTDVLNYFIP